MDTFSERRPENRIDGCPEPFLEYSIWRPNFRTVDQADFYHKRIYMNGTIRESNKQIFSGQIDSDDQEVFRQIQLFWARRCCDLLVLLGRLVGNQAPFGAQSQVCLQLRGHHQAQTQAHLSSEGTNPYSASGWHKHIDDTGRLPVKAAGSKQTYTRHRFYICILSAQ